MKDSQAMLRHRANDPASTILIIGASRGLGLAMAGEFLNKGWNVVATVRGSTRTRLHDLADEYQGRVEIESLDMTEPDRGAAPPSLRPQLRYSVRERRYRQP